MSSSNAYDDLVTFIASQMRMKVALFLFDDLERSQDKQIPTNQ